MRKSGLMLSIMLLCAAPSLFAGISVRTGLLLPQGDFKDYAGKAWSAEIVADVSPFSVPFLSVPVMVNVAGFGEKQTDWLGAPETGPATFAQTSSLTLTGGGVGLKLEPAIPGIKPFVEVFGRLASIEQDYHSGIPDAGNKIESKTKFGYQIDGGLKYSLVPTASLLVGASYVTFLKASLIAEEQTAEIDATMIGVFVGISFSVGW
ncbi:MAG: hypothetical protein ABIJ61_07605 [bacterium]